MSGTGSTDRAGSGKGHTGALRIRAGEPTDAPVLSEIAHEAKRHWGYPDRWMELLRDALTVTPDYIASQVVWVAELDGAAVAFCALSGEGMGWELDHFWVRPACMGRGIGRALFAHAIAWLEAHAPGAVLGIEADPNAEPFYLRMGARRVGETTRTWGGEVRRTLPYLQLVVGRAPEG